MTWLCCLGYGVLLVLVYKALDWLLRLPRIGRYGERYIFITGCDTGFGNMLAKRLDALGCHVFAGCLTEAGETELSKSCSDRMHAVSLDVSKPDSVRRALEKVKALLPPEKGLWGVMNNAGIMGSNGPPEWHTIDDYKLTASVNLYGLIDVTMTFLPLVKMARGRVVNTASIAGRICFNTGIPYSVSKYGVESFTDGVRRSLHPFGVKAILVEPGFHRTHLMSKENVGGWVKKTWERVTPEVREEYGEHYFVKYGEGLTAVEMRCSERLDDVVDAYEHALLGRYPRARYVVGKDAQFLWIPLSNMPACVGDYVMAYLQPKRPLPAALQKRA